MALKFTAKLVFGSDQGAVADEVSLSTIEVEDNHDYYMGEPGL